MTSNSIQRFVVNDATTASPIAQPHQATGGGRAAARSAPGSGCCLRRATATAPAAPRSTTTTTGATQPGAHRRRRLGRSDGSAGVLDDAPASVCSSAGASDVGALVVSDGEARRGLRLLGPARSGRRGLSARPGSTKRLGWPTGSGWASRSASATASSSASASGWASASGGAPGRPAGADVAGGAVPDHGDVPARRDREGARAQRGVGPLPRLPVRPPQAPVGVGGRRVHARVVGGQPVDAATKPGNRWTYVARGRCP